MQQVIAPPLAKPCTSGFAITSLIVGIVATLLTPIDLLLDGGAVLDHQNSAAYSLILVLVFALFAGHPRFIALIFGLLAKARIQNSNGQIKGMGLAYAGITLGSIGIALPVAGVLLFAIARF